MIIHYLDWSQWGIGQCNCGTGLRKDRRTCLYGNACMGPEMRTTNCSRQACPCKYRIGMKLGNNSVIFLKSGIAEKIKFWNQRKFETISYGYYDLAKLHTTNFGKNS